LKIRIFLLRVSLPLVAIFLISYLSHFYNLNSDQGFSGPGGGPGRSALPGKETAGKYYTKQFRWDISEDKTIITRLNLPVKDVKKEMDDFGVNLKYRNPSYLSKRGFILSREGLLIDYRSVFRKSAGFFRKLSQDVIFSADLNKNEDPVICFLKFVQTLIYRIPPKFYNGKFIMEFLPPLNCLYMNYGDCDTKSVLLADFLEGASFKKEKMVVIVLKGYGILHAILAIERIPLPGMLSFYIDRMGPFIPLETTNRGWMPGFSNKQVIQCLRNGQFSFVKLF